MESEMVYVVCDRCQKPTASGISADTQTLADVSNTFRDNQTSCSHCGHMILWSKAELWPLSVVRDDSLSTFQNNKPKAGGNQPFDLFRIGPGGLICAVLGAGLW
jgi:hypothetical protein